jgi:hypothetical protein
MATAPTIAVQIRVGIDLDGFVGKQVRLLISIPTKADPLVRFGMLSNSTRQQGKLDDRWELGRRLERSIQPCHQVAVNKELVAQQGDQIGEAPAEAAPQL